MKAERLEMGHSDSHIHKHQKLHRAPVLPTEHELIRTDPYCLFFHGQVDRTSRTLLNQCLTSGSSH